MSNSLDVTADYVCNRLHRNQLQYSRLNTDQLIEKVKLRYKSNVFSCIVNHQALELGNITCVWYRRPQSLKLPSNLPFEEGEQAHTLSEWNAAIEGFLAHIPIKLWINHPSNNALAISKLEQLSRANRLGLKVPETLVTQSFEEIMQFWRDCQGELIIKPISHGYIKRSNPEEDTLIFTSQVRLEQITNNKELLSLCPSLFQKKVEKRFDVRINIIDKEVIAVAIYASEQNKLQSIDIRRDNMVDVRYELICLPVAIKNKVLELCHSYELRFAAIDMAFTQESDWIFFEINPNGQWAWLDLEGVTDIANSLIQSMQLKFP
ncbi:MAG: MvdC/MvdD family ATP grasp protein [Cyanobacteria bacterium P01_H01_bin.105]